MATRFVTGEDEDGRSLITADEIKEKPLGGGFRYAQLWGADKVPTFPHDGSQPEYNTLYPGPNGYRFMLMRILPSEILSDADKTGAVEIDPNMKHLLEDAGIEDAAAGERPGMHRTDTVDMGVVVSGRLKLMFETGEVTELKAGDVFIQNGTPHAWHNPGDEPVDVFVTMIGGSPRS